MANGLTVAGRAQINMGVTVSLALFVTCMASLFWDGLGKVEKNKNIINIFFGVGALVSAVGVLLGLLAYFKDHIEVADFRILRRQILACPFISIVAMMGAMLVMFFSSPHTEPA